MITADWNATLATGIDPDSRIAKTVKALAEQWTAAKDAATQMHASIAQRYEIYDLHSTEARKISSLRQQRAAEFINARDEVIERIKAAPAEIREEIAADRQRITAAYRAEAAQLRFWQIIKHAKARIRYAKRVAGHKVRLAFHPVAVRTMRRRSMLRQQLRAEANNYLRTDSILAHAHGAHLQEAWIGALRPAVKAHAAPAAQQAGLAI